MNWIQVAVYTTTEGSELVSQELIDAGSAGTMIEDRKDIEDYQNSREEGRWDILDEHMMDKMPVDVRVTGYYPEDFNSRQALIDSILDRMQALRERCSEDLGSLQVMVGTIDDEDWAENWKKAFKPFYIGEHLIVKPGWCDVEVKDGDKVIEMDPGMAFGTGTHETTAMCAAFLEKTVKPGDQVIDVGTGTGILAIAAALCGARSVLATDIDPLAVRVATENIARNHLDDVITTRQGDLLKAVDVTGDIVVANIIADVICNLAAPVRPFIRKGGYFICSGIAREKQENVLKALRDAGYQEIEVCEKGEWAAIRSVNP